MLNMRKLCWDALTRNRYIISAICIISIFMVSWYPGDESDSPQTILEETRDTVDYFANQVTSTFYDDTGRKEYILTSKRLDHFPGDNKTELQAPELTLYEEDGKIWKMRANFGNVWNEQDKIDLTGNIILKEESNSLNPIIFKTEALTLSPKKRYATTQAPVEIIRLQDKITAVGMNLFLDQKRVEFLSNTRGTYDPNAQE